MKGLVAIILIGVFIVTACEKQVATETISKKNIAQTEKAIKIETKNESIEDYTPITELPKEYNPDMAIEKGDVVKAIGNEGNFHKLSRFVENVKNKKPDFIRVVLTTIEGDPIIHDLNFNGKTIHLTMDTTRDAFGNKIIQLFEFDSMISQDSSLEGGNSIKYVLVKEGQENWELITIPK